MNKSDSEKIATVLEKKGYRPVSKEGEEEFSSSSTFASAEARLNEADLIVVNMCSVRQSAVNRVYGLIPKFKKLKEKKPRLKTVLAGCILKEDKKKFRKEFDLIWNIKDYLDVPPKYKNNFLAFIPISNGCNNFCAFCAVPFTRGPLVCRDHREILREVKRVVNPIRNAISNGAREIWLLGQNVNDYQSPTNSSISFSKLLKQVNDIPGNFSIRFTSPNPKNFTDELIDVMTESEKVLKYLNLPVQSGDNQILKKMRRPYIIEQYKKLVKKIRRKMPEINLSTDVIVGFPGETKAQFENTVKLFKEIKFDIAYIAKYSPRPGTLAFKMEDNVPQKEKKRREKILRGFLKKHV